MQQNLREVLLQRIADQLGKPRSELIPWTDYDPILIDDEVWRDHKRKYQPHGPLYMGD